LKEEMTEEVVMTAEVVETEEADKVVVETVVADKAEDARIIYDLRFTIYFGL